MQLEVKIEDKTRHIISDLETLSCFTNNLGEYLIKTAQRTVIGGDVFHSGLIISSPIDARIGTTLTFQKYCLVCPVKGVLTISE